VSIAKKTCARGIIFVALPSTRVTEFELKNRDKAGNLILLLYCISTVINGVSEIGTRSEKNRS